jgi:hypothetical protein
MAQATAPILDSTQAVQANTAKPLRRLALNGGLPRCNNTAARQGAARPRIVRLGPLNSLQPRYLIPTLLGGEDQ